MSAAMTPGPSSALPEILPARTPELYVIVPRSLIVRVANSMEWVRENTTVPKYRHADAQNAQAEGFAMAQDAERDARYMLAQEDALPDLIALAQRVARLNPKAGEIGPGMLVQLVEEANYVLAKAGQP